MTSFLKCVDHGELPENVQPLLEALWHDARGEWERAHEIAQDIDSADAARVHAYLHRKEGDAMNAGYWYRRAGVRFFDGTLEAEWRALAASFLSEN